MGKKIRINISIDENILESLDYQASLNGMNRSSYITKLITDKRWDCDYYMDLPLDSPRLKTIFDE